MKPKKLTALLAYSQIMAGRRRSVWTLLGIALSSAMLTAVCGFVASAYAAFAGILGEDFYRNPEYRTTLIGVGTVLGLVIVTASVIVVSNAFRVSAGERTAQFGMLKSTGATKRQIAATVMYEGLFLSIVGIPVGIALGLLVELATLRIADYLLVGLNELNAITGQQLHFPFVLSWQGILIALAASFLTVLLSAWLPARKAAKIPAIDAIRGAGEVKIKAKQIRTSRLTQKLFGFEGTLAAKSLKRSRRNFRATVVSLTISVVMIIAASGFGSSIKRMSDLMYPDVDASVVANYASAIIFTEHEDGDGTRYKEREVTMLDDAIAREVAEKLRKYPDTEIFGVGTDSFSYETTLPGDMLTKKFRDVFDPQNPDRTEYPFSVCLVAVDDAHYAQLCQLAGVPVGSNILVNHRRQRVNDKRTDMEPFVFTGQTLRTTHTIEGTEMELPLHGVLGYGQVPNEILYMAAERGIVVLVPQLDAITCEWFANPADPFGFSDYARGVLEERIPHYGEEGINSEVVVIMEATDAIRSMSRLVMVFIYGFVGMLTLIGLTNVISTISTNMRARKREFAVLQSTGMTREGLKRMLNLESILCSARSLLYGLPVGAAAAWLIYRFVIQSADFPFAFPWLAMGECVLGVFIVTWVTMRYSAWQMRGSSVVEGIRGE